MKKSIWFYGEPKKGDEVTFLKRLDAYGNPIHEKWLIVDVYRCLEKSGVSELWEVEIIKPDGTLKQI